MLQSLILFFFFQACEGSVDIRCNHQGIHGSFHFNGARFSGEQLKSLAMIEERITEIRYRFNELKQLQKEHLNGQSQPDAFDVLGRFQPIHGPTLIEKRLFDHFVPEIRHCDALYNHGVSNNGIYTVLVDGREMEVFCEFNNNGHNWLVFQRRINAAVDFYRGWTDYDVGFGNKLGNFWLGLSKLYDITRKGEYTLRVELEDFNGDTAYAEYSRFSIGNPALNYHLKISGYSGSAGNSLSYHDRQAFTTKDRDNDHHYRGRNCAVDGHGAWWYNSCQHSNLNGRYIFGGVEDPQGIIWYHWKGNHYSVMRSKMMLRPA